MSHRAWLRLGLTGGTAAVLFTLMHKGLAGLGSQRLYCPRIKQLAVMQP